VTFASVMANSFSRSCRRVYAINDDQKRVSVDNFSPYMIERDIDR
jgi:hypothetical protein